MEEFRIGCPDNLIFENQVFSIDFHPSRNLLATGISDGNAFIHEYSAEANKVVASFSHHSGSSVRCVAFSPDGSQLYTAGGDKSLRCVDVNTGKMFFENTTNEEAINAVEVFENYIFTGDDAGCVKIWDSRKPGKAAFEIRENWDYISDLCCYEPQKTLFATGGDERMSVIDFRKGKLVAVSQDQEDELLCVQVMKGGRKVVVGSQLGVLLIFSWGQWLDTTDRFPGHPSSVDCMVALDDDTVITGSDDGVIRIVNVIPNKMIGIVGEHDDDMPVQRLAIDYNKSFLGSCSDDNTVKFWNIKFLFDDADSEGAGDEEEEEVADEAANNSDQAEGDNDENDDDSEDFEEDDEDDDLENDDDDAANVANSDDEDDQNDESDIDDDDDEEDDESEETKPKVRGRDRAARIPKRKRMSSDEAESNSSEEDGSSNDAEPEPTEEPRVKADPKQKLSTLLTSLPVGQKLSIQERRQLIKDQRKLKKSIKKEKQEKRAQVIAAKEAKREKAPPTQSSKKRKVNEHSEAADFFSDL